MQNLAVTLGKTEVTFGFTVLSSSEFVKWDFPIIITKFSVNFSLFSLIKGTFNSKTGILIIY